MVKMADTLDWMKKRYGKRKVVLKPKSPRHITVRLAETEHPLSHVPEDELPKVTGEIGAAIEAEHARLLTRFDTLVRSCNPLQTLAHFAFYDRFLHEIQKGKAYKPLLQHSVEFFQGYFLTIPIAELKVRVTPDEVLLELNEVLRGLETTFPMLGFGKPSENETEARTHSMLGHGVRAHTYAVRNAGYYRQVMSQLRGVFGRLDADFAQARGVKLSALVTMNERVLDLIEGRLQAHVQAAFTATRQRTPDQVVKAYCLARSLPPGFRDSMLEECAAQRLTVKQARLMCAHDAAFALPQVYGVELDDFLKAYPEPVDPQRLLSVLVGWALPPQGLTDFNQAHLFLNNPVWQKPLVQIGPERFFWPMVELFHSFGLEMLEGLLRSETTLWERYQNRARAEYLEEKVYKLCRSAFPEAQVFHGSLWQDHQAGIKGENDVLVVFDTVALAVECKSGRITPEARRGLPDRLRREVKKLIEDASKQSSSFAELLLGTNDVLRLPTLRGEVNEFDASKIKRVVRLNVTLDYFGPLSCSVRDMVDAKLIDPTVATAPTMAIVDFENVLHLVPTPIERLHYFARRADVERHISLFAGEEDLLACYLAIGLNFGHLEDANAGRLHLGKMQDSVQPYLRAYHSGRVEIKPRRKFTHWWKQILERLQSKAFHNWSLAGFAILDMRHEDQKSFEQAVRRLIKEVKSKWHQPDHLNKVICVNGPRHRSTAVGAAIVKGGNREHRNEVVSEAMNHAVEKAQSDDVVILHLSADTPTWPYSAIAIYDPQQG